MGNLIAEIPFCIKVNRFGSCKVQVSLIGMGKVVILGTCRTEEEAKEVVKSAFYGMRSHELLRE